MKKVNLVPPLPQTSAPTLTVGTRGSQLAQIQTRLVISALQSLWPDLEIVTRIIKTTGDRQLDVSTVKLGKGVFVREIEKALLEGEIDFAVHSCKDLPTDPVPGLILAAFPQRADPRDVLITREGVRLSELPAGAVVGTSSNRRKAQLLIQRPDLQVADIRGNVDTRLRKLQNGAYDAILLAAAGLQRLGWLHLATEILDIQIMLPAPAQGALAIQARADDITTLARLAPLNDPVTQAAVSAERAFLRTLGGGCHVPIASFADVTADQLTLHGLVAAPDGSACARVHATGSPEEAVAIGEKLAQQMQRDYDIKQWIQPAD